MEKARKEELEKAVAVKKGTPVICDKTGRRLGSADQKLVNGEKYKKVDARYPGGTSPDVKARKEAFKNINDVKLATNSECLEKGQSSATLRQEKPSLKVELSSSLVSDDVFSLNDEAAKEQLKKLEGWKQPQY